MDSELCQGAGHQPEAAYLPMTLRATLKILATGLQFLLIEITIDTWQMEEHSSFHPNDARGRTVTVHTEAAESTRAEQADCSADPARVGLYPVQIYATTRSESITHSHCWWHMPRSCLALPAAAARLSGRHCHCEGPSPPGSDSGISMALLPPKSLLVTPQ